MVTPIDGASSVNACAIALARLNADGTVPVGAHNLYQHKRFVKVTLTPVMETGVELTLKTGCGDLDISAKSRDLPKRWDVEIEFTYPDEEALEIATGGAVLLDSTGSTIGFQVPHLLTVANPHGCSVEVWEEAFITDAPDAAKPYWHHALPRVYLDMAARSMENKPNTTLLRGYAIENPLWALGPRHDFTDDGLAGGTAEDTTAAWQYIRAAALPTPLKAGYQTTTA